MRPWASASILLVLFAGFAHAVPPPPPPTGTLGIKTSDGATLEPGAHIDHEELLVFDLSGSQQRYLYLLERGPNSLSLIHPKVGSVHPATRERLTVRPQPTWLTEEDDERLGWKPEVSGSIEYILVSSAVPRDAPSDARLRSIEQLLLGQPYVKGPAGTTAFVVARQVVNRTAPPDEPPDAPEPPDEPELH